MKTRDYSLDYLRVVSCILVIVIHVANVYCRAYANIEEVSYIGSVVFNSLARISVPIFFMISGALLIKNTEFDMKKYLKRIWRLLFALIIWNIFYYIFNHFYLDRNDDLLKSIFTSFFDPTKRHLWFMYAIIGIYIALPFIQKMCCNLSRKEENLFMGLYLFFVGFVYVIRGYLVDEKLLSSSVNIDYPIPLIQAAYYLGYFIIGYILYKRVQEKELPKKYTKHLVLVPITCFIITILITLNLSDKYNTYYNYYLGYRGLFYILSSVSIFLLFINKKNKFKELKIISSISGLSFGIYLIHPIFLDIIKKIVLDQNIVNQLSYIYIPIYTIIIFTCSYITCLIIKKIPFINKSLG